MTGMAGIPRSFENGLGDFIAACNYKQKEESPVDYRLPKGNKRAIAYSSQKLYFYRESVSCISTGIN